MNTTRGKLVLSFALFILLVSALLIYRQLEFPAPGGPYRVGRTTIRWIDTLRPEVLTEDPNDFREAVALIWYPAELGTGVRAGYFPDVASVSEELVNSGEVAWWETLALRFIRSQVPLDASPLRGEEPFPVVILSPGNGTNIEFYSSLAGEIASHGYMVVGINHPYDVAAVELSTGQIAPYMKDQWLLDIEAHQAYIAQRIAVRTADLLHALEQLDELNAAGPFAGTMDLGAVAVAGHSLGGITASEACKADGRFKACLNLDGLQAGGPFSTDETAIPPEQPFMFITKETQLHPRLLERFEAMSESYWVVVLGASHESFTDGPMLQTSLFPGSSQANHIMTLVQKYSVAFLDHALKGGSAGLLIQSADKEDVSVKAFPSR